MYKSFFEFLRDNFFSFRLPNHKNRLLACFLPWYQQEEDEKKRIEGEIYYFSGP